MKPAGEHGPPGHRHNMGVRVLSREEQEARFTAVLMAHSGSEVAHDELKRQQVLHSAVSHPLLERLIFVCVQLREAKAAIDVAAREEKSEGSSLGYAKAHEAALHVPDHHHLHARRPQLVRDGPERRDLWARGCGRLKRTARQKCVRRPQSLEKCLILPSYGPKVS